jgi:hypothetical protein
LNTAVILTSSALAEVVMMLTSNAPANHPLPCETKERETFIYA